MKISTENNVAVSLYCSEALGLYFQDYIKK